MVEPGQGIRLRGSARSHTGKVRDNNEDHVHLWTRDDNVILAVVADGMGGAVAGEEASRIAVKAVEDGLTDASRIHPLNYNNMPQEDISEHLRQVIRSGNGNIVDQAIEQPELKGMGTTITLAFIQNTDVVIGHVGDSRAYLVDGDDGTIMQITSDHSFVQALVAAGHISEEEAEEHPMRNVLYRALGQGRDIEIDMYHQKLHIGDRLVMCSDGLTLHVRPSEIASIVLSDEDPMVCSKKLIDLANERGGRDNVSVIVIVVEQNSDLNRAEDSAEAYHDEYDDEDTLILNPNFGFASSESSNSPHEPREGGGRRTPEMSYKRAGMMQPTLSRAVARTRSFPYSYYDPNDEECPEGRDQSIFDQ